MADQNHEIKLELHDITNIDAIDADNSEIIEEARKQADEIINALSELEVSSPKQLIIGDTTYAVIDSEHQADIITSIMQKQVTPTILKYTELKQKQRNSVSQDPPTDNLQQKTKSDAGDSTVDRGDAVDTVNKDSTISLPIQRETNSSVDESDNTSLLVESNINWKLIAVKVTLAVIAIAAALLIVALYTNFGALPGLDLMVQAFTGTAKIAVTAVAGAVSVAAGTAAIKPSFFTCGGGEDGSSKLTKDHLQILSSESGFEVRNPMVQDSETSSQFSSK